MRLRLECRDFGGLSQIGSGVLKYEVILRKY
jgi:hypothetical protein